MQPSTQSAKVSSSPGGDLESFRRLISKSQLESEKAVDNPIQSPICNIVDLPTELLLRIISFLPMGSIRNLMVNRSLRPVCEQQLYKSICLPRHPQRTIRLLETFLLRPDLALLIRHLEIDFDFNLNSQEGVDVLSLAKNIQSFSLARDENWIWESYKGKLRQAIFKMQLVRLEIPVLKDPHTLHHFCDGGWNYWPGADRSVDVGDAIRKLLQAQPSLEELKFSNSDLSSKSVASLQACLRSSDIPSLKSLQATPWVALAFLPVAPRLESLNLMLVKWDDGLIDEIESKSAAIKLSIRRFDIRVWHSKSDSWFWKNLAKVLALFPNAEQLSVAIDTKKDVFLAEVYFEAVRLLSI